MENVFQTPDDFLRHCSALAVTCRNCDHQAFIEADFLRVRLGRFGKIARAGFRCSRCQNRNVKLSAAPSELGRPKINPKMHFAGVYENKLMDYP